VKCDARERVELACDVVPAATARRTERLVNVEVTIARDRIPGSRRRNQR
jgi:hypothetical protein